MTTNVEQLSKLGGERTNVDKLEEMSKGYDVGNNTQYIDSSMNVDELARVFEVHGNTVQNWFKRGGIGQKIDLPDNNISITILDIRSDLFILGAPTLGADLLNEGEGHGETFADVALHRYEDGKYLMDVRVSLKNYFYAEH